MFNKDIDVLSNRQSAMNGTITEIKNMLEFTNSMQSLSSYQPHFSQN